MFFFSTSTFLLVAAVCAVAQNVYSGDYARASATSSSSVSDGGLGNGSSGTSALATSALATSASATSRTSGSDMEFIPVQEYKPHPSLSVGTGAYGAPSARSGYVEDDANSYSAQKTKTVTKVSQRVKSESGSNSGARGHTSLPSLSTSRLPAPKSMASSFGSNPLSASGNNGFIGFGSTLLSTISPLPALLLAFPSVSYGFPNVNGLFGSSSGAPYAAGEDPAVNDYINKFASNGLSIQDDSAFVRDRTYLDAQSENPRPRFSYVALPNGRVTASTPQRTKTVTTTVTEIGSNNARGSNRGILSASGVPVISGVYRPSTTAPYRPVLSAALGGSPSSSVISGAVPDERPANVASSSSTTGTSASSTSYSSSSSHAGSSTAVMS